jgi:hypothetical protein
MKPLLVHFVNVYSNLDLENIQDAEGAQDDNYHLNDLNVILTGKDVFNSKNLICEKITNNTKSFENLAKEYLEDFKAQAPNNYDLHYHLVLPNFESYTRHLDIIPPSYNEKQKLIQIRIFPFCFKNNWGKFKELYRRTIFSINDKSIIENYEFVLFKMEDYYADVFSINQYDYEKDYYDESKEECAINENQKNGK